jgi:uncharacterized protein involved in exopolysaccharide biosynthesis
MAIGIFLACVLAALLVAFLSTPIYRGHVLLMPAKRLPPSGLTGLTSQLGGLTAQLGLASPPADDTQEAIATLKSRAFTYAFIQEHDLLPVLFFDRWDTQKSTWIVDDPKEIPTLADGFKLFDDIMTVAERPDTGLVELDVDWRDPALAADWANLLVERVNRELRERAIAEAQRATEFLNEQLQQTSIVELKTAIFNLIESNVQTIMLANTRPEYAFTVIDPAVPAEINDFVRPKRLLLLIIGVVFGAFTAGMAVKLRLSIAAAR